MSERKLQMCFYSAQLHRRAMSCADGPVFGVTLVRSSFHIYASFCEGRTLKYGPYSVASYFVLFRLLWRATSPFARSPITRKNPWQKKIRRWDEETGCLIKGLSESSKNPWRSPMRRKPESSLTSCNEYWGETVGESEEHDCKTMQILGSIHRGVYPSQEQYRLMTTNTKAFDILMDSASCEESISLQEPSIWVEETHKYKDEYEDLAPYFSDGYNGCDSEGFCDEANSGDE